MATIVQVAPMVTRSGGSATSATLAVTFGGAVSALNDVGMILAFGSTAGTPSLTSVIDDKGNNYTVVKTAVLDAFTGSYIANVALNLPPSSPTILTITVGCTVAANIGIAGAAIEVSSGGVIDNNIQNAGATAQPWAASISTVANNEACIIGGLCSTSTTTWSAVTSGFTQSGSTDAFTGLSIFTGVWTSLGANTFNATASAGSTHNAWNALSFQAAAGPAPFTPFTRTNWFVNDTVIQS